jgi:hypothetical protein
VNERKYYVIYFTMLNGAGFDACSGESHNVEAVW